MEVQRKIIRGDGFHIPAILMMPYSSGAAVVIVHGYGGCKEEQLGLAWRIAEMGIATCTIDLRGHGEHSLMLTDRVIEDVETAVQFCRAYGKVAVVGHSLGGRLALLSSADLAIAISPALCKTYTQQTHDGMKKRSFRARAASPETIFEICEALPLWEQSDRPAAIIYGSRDIPEIVKACEEQNTKGVPVTCIENAAHNDTYLLEATFEEIGKHLAAIVSDY
ncbi:alpha/beta hydrolase [Methanocella arvoryzae]|nr:alpha/beta fold hydrolase [Methanocella arvoryzae]